MLVGGHEIVISAVNLEPDDEGPPFYRIKNSWGTSWGKNGTARIAKDDLDDLIFAQGGDTVLIKEVRNA
jgi:aminopeptidase C